MNHTHETHDTQTHTRSLTHPTRSQVQGQLEYVPRCVRCTMWGFCWSQTLKRSYTTHSYTPTPTRASAQQVDELIVCVVCVMCVRSLWSMGLVCAVLSPTAHLTKRHPTGPKFSTPSIARTRAVVFARHLYYVTLCVPKKTPYISIDMCAHTRHDSLRSILRA